MYTCVFFLKKKFPDYFSAEKNIFYYIYDTKLKIIE